MNKEQREALGKPFSPEVVKFKIQAEIGGDGALVVAYVDARDVMERLDEVFDNWNDAYKPVDIGGKQGIECIISIGDFASGKEISRADVGEITTDGFDQSLKSGYSDAFKRAAVKFGVARYLYDLPRMTARIRVQGRSKVIDPQELPRLQAIVAGQIVTPTWSPQQLEWARSVSVEVATEGMTMAELPHNAGQVTIESWARRYVEATGSPRERADIANQAYQDAVNRRNNA